MIKERLIAMLDKDGRGYAQAEPMPPLTKGCVQVKVHASLVSPGTELGDVRRMRAGETVTSKFPRSFGYQNAGEILECGEGVTQFKPGDRVACMGGGAKHANYGVVPQNLCVKLPDNVSYEEGAFNHLAATSLNAVRRGQPELGEYVLVVGLGLVGQMAARFAQLSGAYVMGWDTLPQRCVTGAEWSLHAVANPATEDASALAKAFTKGHGFDMAVMTIPGDATKALDAVQKAMKRSPDTHQMGRICLLGGTTTCMWGAALGNLDLRACSRTGPGYHDDPWELGERDYPSVFMRWTTRSNIEFVLRLISEGKFPVSKLISHRIPLERIDEAITAHVDQTNTTMGTIITMPH